MHTLLLLSLMVLALPVNAETVHIPDVNLRRAIAEALEIPHELTITEDDMMRLRHLPADARGIIELTGLESATQLVRLSLGSNYVVDLTPLAPLTNLTSLRLNANRIVDVTPLANLANLVDLFIDNNDIVDVSALAEMSQLQVLEIHKNPIADLRPLDGLSLSHFIYDQVCEMPPLPLEPRVYNRNYPSIIARWSGRGWPPVSNRPELSPTENLALHDLRFSVGVFGLEFREMHNGFKMVGPLPWAIGRRDDIIALNPNAVHLYDMSVRAAALHEFPEDSPYWLRDVDGRIFSDVINGVRQNHGFIDFTKPETQDYILAKAIAVSECGLFDGIFFDYWSERWTVLGGFNGTIVYFPYTLEEEIEARLTLVRRIRAATRPNFLIMGNVSSWKLPRTAPYVNGGFLETVLPFDSSREHYEFHLTSAENALAWLDANLREPQLTGLEGWAIPSEPPDSPTNLRWMRAFTTLSLTRSDGYVVYTEPVKWTHYWYDFWDADLGRPVGEKSQLYQDIDGLYIREFTNGWAVYNHSGEAQAITLPEEVQGVASGLVNTEHALPNLDGEMYLRVKPVNPADVNGDGVVNILDLVVVAQAFGKDGLQGDVNGDGVVNVFDLVQVAGAIGAGSAAPSAYSLDASIISAADVERWLAGAQGLGAGDVNFQRGIRFLEGLLAALTPKETTLLPNYPNPFNPETWIPYRLAREAEVAITIYDTKGTPVRQLALGNQAAGYYAERGKAAYWDGRNEDGEAVASGIYIYQFRAGDYAASRRMVIVK